MIKLAGMALVEEGYLLREDRDDVVAAALARFDDVAKGTPLAAKP